MSCYKISTWQGGDCYSLNVVTGEGCFTVVTNEDDDTEGDDSPVDDPTNPDQPPYSYDFELPEDVNYIFAAHIDSKNIILYVIKNDEGWLYAIPYMGRPTDNDLVIELDEDVWIKTLIDPSVPAYGIIDAHMVYDLFSVKNHGFSDNTALGLGGTDQYTLISDIYYTPIQNFSIDSSGIDFLMFESEDVVYSKKTSEISSNVNWATTVTIPRVDSGGNCTIGNRNSNLDAWGNSDFATDFVAEVYDITNDEYSNSTVPAEFVRDNYSPDKIDCSYDYVSPPLKWYLYIHREIESENYNHQGTPGTYDYLIGKFDIVDSSKSIAIYKDAILFNAYKSDPVYRFYSMDQGTKEGWEYGGVQYKCGSYVDIDTRDWQISPVYDGYYLYTSDMTRYADGGNITIYDMDGNGINSMNYCVHTARDGYIYYTEDIESTTLKIRRADLA